MTDTNYFSGMVKLLENPQQINVSKTSIRITVRAELFQIRENKLIRIHFWGNLGQEVREYYRMNDYILVEGYLSIPNKNPKNLEQKPIPETSITVLKIYPFLLQPN